MGLLSSPALSPAITPLVNDVRITSYFVRCCRHHHYSVVVVVVAGCGSV